MTSLYVKRHLITGKYYLGKTIRDPLTYLGSGRAWKEHLLEHGNFIETLWHHKFEDQALCTRVALKLSEELDVVKSDLWLNRMIETGIGGWAWMQKSQEHLDKIANAKRGKPLTANQKLSLSKRAVGEGNSRTLEWTLESMDGCILQVKALKAWCAARKIPYASLTLTQKHGRFAYGFRVIKKRKITTPEREVIGRSRLAQ